MPGAADDRDAVPELLAGGAQLDPHAGFAYGVAGVAPVPVHLAQCGHGLGEHGERGPWIGGRAVRGAVLDDVLPPALRVVVPGGPGEDADRVDGGRERPPEIARTVAAVSAASVLAALGAPGVVGGGTGGTRRGLLQCQRVRRGQVDEAHRDVVGQCPPDRHPLGRELRHRPEGRQTRVVHGMGEQRDGRTHLRIGGEREQRVALRRPFDEHGIRPGGVQRGENRAGRSGAVMAHPQQQRPGGRGARGHTETSRQAR
ncbi:hypothetical protein ACVWXU_003919 [Streptomyces sp. TE33382]